MVLDRADELTPVKSNGENEFLHPSSLRELADNLLGDVLVEAAVRTKAINEQPHSKPKS